MAILNSLENPITIREMSALYDARKDGPDQRNRIGVMLSCWASRGKVKYVKRSTYARL